MRETWSRLQNFPGSCTKSAAEEYFTNMIAEIWVTSQDVCKVVSMNGSGKNDCSIKGRKSRTIPPPADLADILQH